jgi:hypothetical protein
MVIPPKDGENAKLRVDVNEALDNETVKIKFISDDGPEVMKDILDSETVTKPIEMKFISDDGPEVMEDIGADIPKVKYPARKAK